MSCYMKSLVLGLEEILEAFLTIVFLIMGTFFDSCVLYFKFSPKDGAAVRDKAPGTVGG